MNACRWFEEIPLVKAKQAISSAHISDIAKAATDKAMALGYGDISDRVAGAVRLVSAETQKARFSRLLKTVEDRFEPSVMGNLETALDDLLRAIAFRGKAAHGHFEMKSESDFRMFDRAHTAMEAFCFRLTVRDLPISKMGLVAVWNNTFMEEYRRSW